MTGRVILVGAGPGDPELITLRGARALAAADVVVYDRLVAPALLELAPPTAERVYVGKEPGSHAWPQPAICALLVERARGGATWVAGAYALRLAGARRRLADRDRPEKPRIQPESPRHPEGERVPVHPVRAGQVPDARAAREDELRHGLDVQRGAHLVGQPVVARRRRSDLAPARVGRHASPGRQPLEQGPAQRRVGEDAVQVEIA